MWYCYLDCLWFDNVLLICGWNEVMLVFVLGVGLWIYFFLVSVYYDSWV